MKHDFDSVVDRFNSNARKWDFAEEAFGIADILPLWIADMDFRVPEPVILALEAVARHGIFGYSGLPDSYYGAVINWMARRHNWGVLRDWIVYTPGVMPAISSAIRAFTQAGDHIIVQTPVYYPFFDVIRNNDRVVSTNPLTMVNGKYMMDLDDLEERIGPRTKMLILCSPHNPIGRVWEEWELARLADLCMRNGILVVADELHHDIVYDGFRHTPFLSVSDRLAERAIVCTGVSKTFNLPGLHMANAIIPNPDLRGPFRMMLKSCGIGSPNPFGIAATEAAYTHGEPWLEDLLVYLKSNVSFMMNYGPSAVPRLKISQPEGTYLMWLDFRDCGIESSRLKDFVRRDALVGLQPGRLFGAQQEGFERMNIGCPRSVLAEALDRIRRALSSLADPWKQF